MTHGFVVIVWSGLYVLSFVTNLVSTTTLVLLVGRPDKINSVQTSFFFRYDDVSIVKLRLRGAVDRPLLNVSYGHSVLQNILSMVVQ